MRRFWTILILGAVMCGFIAVAVADYSATKCVYLSTGSCHSAANFQCAGKAEGTFCYYCDGGETGPQNMCVANEATTCLVGSSAVNCGRKMKGKCSVSFACVPDGSGTILGTCSAAVNCTGTTY